MFAYYTHNLSPFLWEFGNGWGIRYYGLAYFLGFLAFYGGMVLFYKWGWSKLPSDKIVELMTWGIIGVLIGGRLGYCLVYDFEETLRDPLSIIAFWRGGISGMSSHGGIIGAVAVLILYARHVKTDVWQLFDHAAILTTPGLFLGRIANFINGELWGRPTHLPWGVIFPRAPDDGLPRHPSQLYEALGEGLFLGVVLLWLRAKGVSNGRIAFLFLILYGIIRIALESFREPDEQIGFLFGIFTLGQILSLLPIAAGMILWVFKARSDLKKQNRAK